MVNEDILGELVLRDIHNLFLNNENTILSSHKLRKYGASLNLILEGF